MSPLSADDGTLVDGPWYEDPPTDGWFWVIQWFPDNRLWSAPLLCFVRASGAGTHLWTPNTNAVKNRAFLNCLLQTHKNELKFAVFSRE